MVRMFSSDGLLLAELPPSKLVAKAEVAVDVKIDPAHAKQVFDQLWRSSEPGPAEVTPAEGDAGE